MMVNERLRRAPALWVATVLALVELAACSGSGRAPLATTPLPAVSSVHQLGPGDRVRISVYGEQALSGEFLVSGAGTLSMPLIGDVQAAGLTASQLQVLLVDRYGAGYLRSPKIVVDSLDVRPFSVLGEVARPGQYPSRDGMTVLDAVALAGGYTYRANKGHVFIRRAGETAEHEVDMSRNPVIAPGDIIRIGERYF